MQLSIGPKQQFPIDYILTIAQCKTNSTLDRNIYVCDFRFNKYCHSTIFLKRAYRNEMITDFVKMRKKAVRGMC